MAGIIAIAFEDVITDDSDFWSGLMKYFRAEGHKVLIIGEAPGYTLDEGIEYHGLYEHIHYDEIISILDYLIKHNENIYYDENQDRWRTREPSIWRDAKARICLERKVNLMIDTNHQHALAFHHIPTRVELIDDEEVMEMFKKTRTSLAVINEWFDEYESEFQVY